VRGGGGERPVTKDETPADPSRYDQGSSSDDGGDPGDEKGAAQRVQAAHHQAGQGLGIAIHARDLAEIGGARCAHGGVAERDHRHIAARACGGESPDAIGAGEHHGLNAGQRALERGGRPRLLRDRQQRVEQNLMAVGS